LPSCPAEIRGCKTTLVPPRRPRPRRTWFAPWINIEAVRATKINKRAINERPGFELEEVVDTRGESRVLMG